MQIKEYLETNYYKQNQEQSKNIFFLTASLVHIHYTALIQNKRVTPLSVDVCNKL